MLARSKAVSPIIYDNFVPVMLVACRWSVFTTVFVGWRGSSADSGCCVGTSSAFGAYAWLETTPLWSRLRVRAVVSDLAQSSTLGLALSLGVLRYGLRRYTDLLLSLTMSLSLFTVTVGAP